MHRKPAKLRLLEGNPGKRQLPSEPVPANDPALCPPPSLSAVAFAEWERLRGDMSAKGVLTAWDRGVMAAYCQTYADWLDAQAHVNADGMVVQGRFGPAPNPYLTIARAAKTDLLRLAGELGLTPVARARLGTMEEREESAGDVPASLRDASGG